jgi:hypothetical protein
MYLDDPTYVVAGHPDPHLGKPILEPPMIDEYPSDDNGDGYTAMVREGDNNLTYAVLAANYAAGAAEDKLVELGQWVERYQHHTEQHRPINAQVNADHIRALAVRLGLGGEGQDA